LKDDPEMPELVEDVDSDSDDEANTPQDFMEELYKDFPSLRIESHSSSSCKWSNTKKNPCAANHMAEDSRTDTTEPRPNPTGPSIEATT
jgi:hypothetical protein